MNRKSQYAAWQKYEEGVLTRDELRRVTAENEVEANLFVCRFLICFAALMLLISLLIVFFFNEDGHRAMVHACLSMAVLTALSAVYGLSIRGQGKHLKSVLCISSLIAATIITIFSVKEFWGYMTLTIIVGCRYYDSRFTVKTAVVTMLCTAVAEFSRLPVSLIYKHGYADMRIWEMILSPQRAGAGINALNDGSGFLQALIYSKVLDSLSAMPVILLVSVICVVVAANGRRMIVKTALEIEENERMKLEQEKMRSRIMLSQIRPHFLYNTLTAIMAIDGNPDETIEAISEFGQYLRENLNTLSSCQLTSIQQEIRHVQRYVSLEKLRFKERLNIRYELNAQRFILPTLTVQMLVENAIKHGLQDKKEGGTITVATEEMPQEYRVIVRDDGVGFDPLIEMDDEENHTGLRSVRSRLKLLQNGTLSINSIPGSGTTAIVHIPKSNQSSIQKAP